MVRPESNSRPPARQPDAQPTEPPVRGKHDYTRVLMTMYRQFYEMGNTVLMCFTCQVEGDGFLLSLLWLCSFYNASKGYLNITETIQSVS